MFKPKIWGQLMNSWDSIIILSFGDDVAGVRQNDQHLYVSACCFLLFKRHMSEWVKLLSRVWLFASPWTATCQAPPSMGFSRQEHWSGLPFLLQEIFPTQGLSSGLPHCRQTFYCLSHQGSPRWRGEPAGKADWDPCVVSRPPLSHFGKF